MERTKQNEEPKGQPLAMHIRRMRQWYENTRSLKQRELSELAGVSVRQVRRYERATDVPHEIAAFLKIAFALRAPIESLVSSDWARRERQTIEARRYELGLTASPPKDPYDA